MKKLLSVLSAFGLCAALLFCLSCRAQSRALSDSLVRLHVVAHSSSQADQAHKEAVRDALLACFFTDAKSGLAAEKSYIAQNLGNIRAVAARTLAERGCTEPVQVSLGRYRLPQKDYGSFALPAGEYEALRVTIGEGEGSNWWCVLFPPLCVAPAAALRETAGSAGVDEQGIALMTGDGQEIRLRFKVLEILSDIEEKLFGR